VSDERYFGTAGGESRHLVAQLIERLRRQLLAKRVREEAATSSAGDISPVRRFAPYGY
jgi:hypothetical protein